MYTTKVLQAVRPQRSICLIIERKNVMERDCDKTKWPNLRAANCIIRIRKPTGKQMGDQSSFFHGYLCAYNSKQLIPQ